MNISSQISSFFSEKEANNNGLVIFDRSVIDWIVYVGNAHQKDLDHHFLSRPEVVKIVERFVQTSEITVHYFLIFCFLFS